MSDPLTPAQQQLMRLIHHKKMAPLIGQTLAEIAVELMDAKREAAHWKQSFETVRDEIKVLAGVAIKQRGERLVVTRKELQELEGRELHVGNPEPGVRIYELRERTQISQAVSKILRPN